MLKKLFQTLWGNFESRDELKKFGFLAVIFGLIIGTYWGFRPMKDSIFGAIVDIDYQPIAKLISLCVIAPLVILYTKLIDMFPRQKVFYVLTGIYGSIAVAFAMAFMHPAVSVVFTDVNVDLASWSWPWLVGWAWYIYVESFGSLVVALFWAITTDITIPDAAKRGFPLIALIGQMGNIFGPYVLQAKKLGFSTSAPVVLICAGLTFLIGFMMWLFMKVTPKSQLVGYQSKDAATEVSEPGFLEGLRLLLTRGYLFGIFAIIAMYEIIVTIFDFHFKRTVKTEFPLEADNAAFLSNYGTWTGIVATLCVLFGINSIQRKLGMRASLLLLPVFIAIATLVLYMNPTGVQALNVAFWVMVFSKAVNYALNQPTIKQLYIPTTKDTKYKATAWVEMFGSRGSKAAASAINFTRRSFVLAQGPAAGVIAFLTMSSMISGGLLVAWVFVAIYVSKKYDTAIKNNEVVC